MRRRVVIVAVLTALAALAAGSAARAGGAPSTPGTDTVPALPAHSVLVEKRALFDRFAVDGLAVTRTTWWNPAKGWYSNLTTGDRQVASLWSVLPFLELTAAVAIEHPTAANKAFVNETFLEAEQYWDPTLGVNGSGGVSWLWKLRHTGNAYFDDAGWWGAAYLDAYQATGKARWLWDAGRALSWIDAFGWDAKGGGGMWWDTGHDKKTSEPLAAATLIAATLYRIDHKKYFLRLALKYIHWADANTLNAAQGDLYGRNATDGTVMDYVEGMMVGAFLELCKGTGQQSWCNRAESVANASLQQFPILGSWAPETDVIYYRWLLDLYEADGNPKWYAVVYANALRAAAHARDASGKWSLHWDGSYALPGTIYTQSATLELFAWLATATPPAS